MAGQSGDLRRVWEQHAEQWIAWARTPGHDKYFWRLNWPAFMGLLPAPGRLTVDVGCGEGRVSRHLAARGHRVIALDSSPTLAHAAAGGPDPVPVAVADAARLPLPDGSADLVVAFMSLQDVDDLETTVGEAARVLSPGGHLCLAVTHPFQTSVDFDPTDRAACVSAGSYFSHRRIDEQIERHGLTMTFSSMHRPLQAYTGALAQAGLLVDRLLEPRPDDAWAAEEPAVTRWWRVPIFLHIRAVKPED